MSGRRPIGRELVVLTASVLIHSSAWTAATMPRQLYEVTTETALPHLEENLRYATTRERRCLEQNELWSAFSLLQHAALKDCRLQQESGQQDALSYALVCTGGHGTTGHATWQLGRTLSIGTLNVKLGGKNMTLYQRVTARALGACSTPLKESVRQKSRLLTHVCRKGLGHFRPEN